MSDEDPYCYPGTDVLRNKAGIRDPARLDVFERLMYAQRAREGVPRGRFDLAHLKAIHRHLFQDVYDWAGEIRTVGLSKGYSAFLPSRMIEGGMAEVSRDLVRLRYLQGLSADEFAPEAAAVIGNVNHVHPFREGNGRTQFAYLEQLALQAGHEVDLTKLNRKDWIEGSIRAQLTDFEPLGRCIRAAMVERPRDWAKSPPEPLPRSSGRGRGR